MRAGDRYGWQALNRVRICDLFGDDARYGGVGYERQIRAVLLETADRENGDAALRARASSVVSSGIKCGIAG